MAKKRAADSKDASAKAALPKKKQKAASASVTIEACKTWNAFKTRASKLEKLLKAAGIDDVQINDDSFLTAVNKKGAKKPRTGCFEIIAGGETVISLVGLKRPFKDLKALDIDDVAADVIKAMQ